MRRQTPRQIRRALEREKRGTSSRRHRDKYAEGRSRQCHTIDGKPKIKLSRAEAEHHVLKWEQRGEKLDAYRCRDCQGWHVGNPREN